MRISFIRPAGVVFRSGVSLASEGGASFAAHATTAVQEAADQVVLNAGLTAEQGQLVGVLIGTAVGVLMLCCVRVCRCHRADRRGGGAPRPAPRPARPRRESAPLDARACACVRVQVASGEEGVSSTRGSWPRMGTTPTTTMTTTCRDENSRAS